MKKIAILTMAVLWAQICTPSVYAAPAVPRVAPSAGSGEAKPFEETDAISMGLSDEVRKELLVFLQESRKKLEKALADAHGLPLPEALNEYVKVIQKVVPDSFGYKPQEELLMRLNLESALVLTVGRPDVEEVVNPDGSLSYKIVGIKEKGTLKGMRNKDAFTYIVEDSIRLAIAYTQDDEAAAQEGQQSRKVYEAMATDRLMLAAKWYSYTIEPYYRKKLLESALGFWLDVIRRDENLEEKKFKEELILVDDALAEVRKKGKYYADPALLKDPKTQGQYLKKLGASERLLYRTLKTLLNSLPSKVEGLKQIASAPAGQGSFQGGPARSMNFVSLSGGTFEMGCAESTDNCQSDEKPVHSVTLPPFEIMTTEVTQGMWNEVMGSNPSHFSSCGDDCPVEQVSWDDAQTFIGELNKRNDGYFYRLPTEAEWEYAARAPVGPDYKPTEYSSGNGEAALQQVGWYSGNSGETTHPVAQKKANAFGLHDMHGNVWEWTMDWYDENYYGSSAKENPPGEASGGSYRVLRGGSWVSYAGFARSGDRNRWGPGDRDSDVGFRLARTAR